MRISSFEKNNIDDVELVLGAGNAAAEELGNSLESGILSAATAGTEA